MIRAFAVALAWLPALVGLGGIVPLEVSPALRAPLRGWFGLAVLAAAALLLNLATPLSPPLALAAAAIGWLLFLARARRLAAGISWAEPLAVAALLLLLAGMTRPIVYHYDTGLYHLQLLKWAEAARLLPGLGLVHHRFGTASFWAQLCALLELPGVGEGGSAAYAALIPSGLALWTALAALRLGPASARFGGWALAGLPAVILAQPWELGGLGPDLPLALLVYLCLALWALALTSPEEADWAGPAALFLAAVALALKLSAAPVFAASLGFAAWRRRSAPLRAWAVAAGAGAVLLALWTARNLLATGCLLYPAAASCLPLPWRVPDETVRDLAAWTRSWARAPGLPPDQVLGNWSWLGPWSERVGAEPAIRFLALALVLAVVLAALARRRPSVGALAAWAAAVAGVAFWFSSAPDPRFGLGILLAAALLPLAWALSAQRWAALRTGRAVILAGWVAALAGLGWTEVSRLGPIRLPEDGWQPLPVPYLGEHPSNFGLQETAPLQGDQCWDAPLPCTPTPDARLAWDGRWFALRSPRR